MHTSNTDHDETLKEQILTEFKQVHKLAPADYTENCTNVVMSIMKGDRDRAVREARLDELKQLWNSTQPDIVPEGAKANDMSEQLHKRIAELQSTIKTNRSI